MKTLFLLSCVAGSLCAQTRHATRPFTPPEEYYTSRPAVAKDEGCARDYARALALEGIEQRKMLADLVRYGCLDIMDGAVYRAFISESRTFVGGKQEFAMVKVRLTSSRETLPVGAAVLKEGWVLRRSLATSGEIAAAKTAGR